MEKFTNLTQLFLRLALGIGYLVPGFDRLGVSGKYGERNVTWGDWQHFVKYAGQVMSFLPSSLVNVFAVMATIAEIGFGVLLLVGRWTKIAALGSGILTLILCIVNGHFIWYRFPFKLFCFYSECGKFFIGYFTHLQMELRFCISFKIRFTH